MDATLDFNSSVSTGTTIVGVSYNSGVVLGGADSRTTSKITELTENVYLCRPGSAADTQIVRYFLDQHTTQLGQPATVKAAANLVRSLAYNNKNMVQAGMIVGGWDKYEVSPGGTLTEQVFSIGGSGSEYLYGFLDEKCKERMTREEAEQLVVKAVSLAIAHGGGCGGGGGRGRVVRIVTINAEGATRKLHPHVVGHEELQPHNSLLDML